MHPKKTVPFNYNRLIPAILPNFSEDKPTKRFFFLSEKEREATEWFEEFTNRILTTIGKSHMPIYRMADGEFQFMVGSQKPVRGSHFTDWWQYIKTGVKNIQNQNGLATCWGETYSREELKHGRSHLALCLKEIAKHGILAINLVSNGPSKPPIFCTEFHQPIHTWLHKHDIELTTHNYFPFYFVYALLSGSRRQELLRGRRILIVTSLTQEKREALYHNLMSEKVKSVEFLPISPNKAMTEHISLTTINEPIDLVLVGAGIGAANILSQLAPLETVCIDAGFALNCLMDSSLCGKRRFTLADTH